MKRYILKRLVISIITIWLIATCSFFLLHAPAGDPLRHHAADEPRDAGQDDGLLWARPPAPEQYLTFLSNLIRGDFGYSLKYVGQSVNGIIAQTFPVSAQLGLQAYLLSFPIGIFFRHYCRPAAGRPLTMLWWASPCWACRCRYLFWHPCCNMYLPPNWGGSRWPSGRALPTPSCPH